MPLCQSGGNTVPQLAKCYEPVPPFWFGPLMADDFFKERADQSEVKARIVMKYFITWAGIIGRRSRSDKIAYIDLYAGPGRYEDGSASTPLMVLTEVLNKPELQDVVVAVFNDKDENHTSTLEKEIAALPGINNLKHKPQVESTEVDQALADYFKTARLIPTFSFIDPFGYKGRVSVENDDYWGRVDRLRLVNAQVKFLSIEPLLGRLTNLNFDGIDWVIVGGESGPKARPLNANWVREIRDACLRQRIAFHFKQWGGRNKKASGRTLDDRTWDQMPEPLHAA
jgi:Protein of unknown function (DUF5131)